MFCFSSTELDYLHIWYPEFRNTSLVFCLVLSAAPVMCSGTGFIVSGVLK
jgi:hypothetical protein